MKIEWSEPQPPNIEGCRYDHVTATLPFGAFSIEWKSWKQHDERTCYFNGEYIGGDPTLDGAKAFCLKVYTDKLAQHAPAHPEGSELAKQTWVCDQCLHCYTNEYVGCLECGYLRASNVPETLIEQYKDRLAPFFLLMARKMAASEIKGRLGWVQCSPQDLSNMLREHVEKGDPVDVANFCFMLSDGESGILPLTGNHWPCWSCNKPVSMKQRADADGDCPHCGVELDIEIWPFNEKTLRELRESGYAVIVWTPEEIGEADIEDLQSLSIQRGHDYLEEFKEAEDDE